MKLRARQHPSKAPIKIEKDSSYSSSSSLTSSDELSSDVVEVEQIQKPIKKPRKEMLLKSKNPVKKQKKIDYKKKFFEEEASEKDSESDYDPQGPADDEKLDQEELKQNILDMNEDQLVEHFQKFDQNMLYDLHNIQGFTANLIDQFELPNLSDPKLFAVRCIPGKEKQFLVRILDSIGFGSTNPSFSIQSVNVIDKFQGFIFFEAYKEFHVAEIIKNIPGIFRSITLIPLSEVPQIFTVDETHRLKLQKNQFIRIKSGIYKDDLAQIISWDTENQQIIAKVVPRINYSLENDSKRPEKQLLKLTDLPTYEEKRDRDNQVYIIFKGKRFINGLLIKRFSMSQIETINVIPTIEEASQFLTSAEDEETQIRLMEELLAQINNSQQVSRQFAKGDKVKVISGELQNLIGSVVSQSVNQVQVAPAFLGMNKDVLNFHSSEIQKFFVEGDSVQFLQGKFKGQEGKIASVEGEVVTVYLFEEQKYVNGLLANVQLIGINQLTTLGSKQTRRDLRKFDLIRSISDRKPCVILKIVNNFITAINENNDLISLNLLQVDEKLNNFRAVCLNRYHQKIIMDSSVRVVNGINAGKSGIVKQIYQDIIFMYNEEFQKTYGIFVEKADNLYLVSSFTYHKQQKTRWNYNIPKPELDESQQTKKKSSRFFPGQLVVIQKGDWKGFQGSIVECDDKVARIELQAQYRIVSVPIKYLIDEQFDEIDEPQPFDLPKPDQQLQQWGAMAQDSNDNGMTWGNGNSNNNNTLPSATNNGWGETAVEDTNPQDNQWGDTNQNTNNNDTINNKKEEHWGAMEEENKQQEEEASAW